MKLITTSLLLATSLAQLTAATASLNECNVTHFGDGNVFTVEFINVPGGSQSSICGSSNREIRNSAKSFSTNVKSLNCGTTGSNMSIDVKFDKQSPSVQRNALVNGLTAAFGSAGVSIDAGKCNIDGIP